MDVLWHKTNLAFWLSLDGWDTETAFDILSGYDPDGRSVPDPEICEYPDNEVTRLFVWPSVKKDWDWNDRDEFVMELNSDAFNFRLKLDKAWNYSNNRMEDINFIETNGYRGMREPIFYIDYFYKRRLVPVWLDWAINEGLVKLDTSNKKQENSQHTFDSSVIDENHKPHELDLAIKAYEYALKKIADGSKYSPKTLIIEYLEENTQSKNKKADKYCSEDGKKRISVVANWSKEGGNKKLT